MEFIKNIVLNRWVLLIIVAFGLAARLAAATLGHNYDMDSWYIVADITKHGGNVYAETDRYNYGPVWFLILRGLDLLAGHRHEVLRYLIAGFLSLVDLGIFLFLLRQAGRVAAVLFFLNPISILITGYHSQFDNAAILLGLWAVRLVGNDFESPVKGRKFYGLLVLGLSLMTKHLLFAFPLWLAVKQKGLLQKVIVMTVPLACFLLSFAPYWAVGRQGIIDNVFSYHSMSKEFFYQFFVPKCIQDCWSSGAVWYGMLFLFAFICRAKNSFESLLIYTGALVAFSPSATNQYLAIPVALTAVFSSVLFVLYTVVSVVHLCGDVYGPHFWKSGSYLDLAIYVLCCALAWHLWRPKFLQLLQRVRQEIALQFDRRK